MITGVPAPHEYSLTALCMWCGQLGQNVVCMQGNMELNTLNK